MVKIAIWKLWKFHFLRHLGRFQDLIKNFVIEIFAHLHITIWTWQISRWQKCGNLPSSLLDGVIESLFEFTAFMPKHRCSVPFCEHPRNTTYFQDAKLSNFPIYVQRGIPPDLLETGESCEFWSISSMPSGLDKEAILSKVLKNLGQKFIETASKKIFI